jgi:hypothetical protein
MDSPQECCARPSSVTNVLLLHTRDRAVDLLRGGSCPSRTSSPMGLLTTVLDSDSRGVGELHHADVCVTCLMGYIRREGR